MRVDSRNVGANRNFFGNLIFPLPSQEKALVRKLEKQLYKLNAAETAAIYNKICLEEGLLPNYTRLRLHDPTAADDYHTRTFRRRLAERQLKESQEKVRRFKNEVQHTKQEWQQIQRTDRGAINDALKDLALQDYNLKERTILRKLNHLNGGKLRIPKKREKYINLTSYTPTPEEEELLQMGLNCHYADKPQPIKKRLEIEVLIDSLMSLEKSGKVELKDPLKPLLLAEALTQRAPDQHHSLMTKELRDAAKHLKQQEGITVRRADKTPALVLIKTEEYHQKLDNILADESKFRRLRKNPVDDIKREANGVIERINALSGAIKLPIIRGDFEPGYIYGNVKSHKTGNPLRPIISQIPTPTYRLAKRLNSLLAPYIPSEYRVQSSTDFLSAVRRTPSCGIMASLDVESLFTNVPVQETIDLICQRVYHNDNTTPLNIPEDALRELLKLCTMKAPFITHRSEMYAQVDGVAMGSPLGVLFADFYMGVIEEKVFNEHPKPRSYFRYVDDTFVQADSFEEIEALRRKFEEKSSLRFTCERSNEGTLPFLDILLTQVNNTTNTHPDETNNTSQPRADEMRISNTSNNNSAAGINIQDNNRRVLRSHTRRLREQQMLQIPTPTTPTPATNTNTNNSTFITGVYRKPTNMGLCLNGVSECPQRYRRTAIASYIRRALTHCSSWKSTIEEIEYATQMLVDNGFSNSEIQRVVGDVMNKWYDAADAIHEDADDIKIYYKNQYHRYYKKDEKALRDIINENVVPTDPNVKLKLTIYYKSRKTASIIMRNNPSGLTPPLRKRNVVYLFKCPHAGCPASYIGMTTMTLSKRISCHAQEGNVFSHFMQVHFVRPTRDTLIDAFKVIDTDQDPRRLRLLEALHIVNDKPSINVTQEPFLLPSCTTQRPRATEPHQ